MQIIPSILVQSKEEFTSQIMAIRDTLDMVQLDIADGIFVSNTTWADPTVVSAIAGDVDVELHLMVQHPLREIERWVDVPQIQKVLVHAEASDDIEQTLLAIKDHGWDTGLVLNPDTDISALDQYIHLLDGAMLMGVVPGKQGQLFIKETVERAAAVVSAYPDLFVEIDGGVNLDTIPDIVPTGVHAICPGSATWGGPQTPADNVLAMQELINSLTETP